MAGRNEVGLQPGAGEIGTLRALGFSKISILTAFVAESTFLALSLAVGMSLAVLMGVVGGVLRAFRAARMPITRALRDA